MKEKLIEIIKFFHKKRILVIGDIMLDKYIYGEVSRISPEAPVQIVKAKKEIFSLGGAGNVANNIKSLDGNVTIISAIGDDNEGNIIKKLLKSKKIKFQLITTDKLTTVKTRIIGQKQQLLRVDYENTEQEESEKILKIIKKEIKKFDVIIISDYAKGLITEKLVENIVSIARVPVIADPKHHEVSYYKNVNIITPNEKEAYDLANMNNSCSLKDVLIKLETETNSKVLMTRGEKGMSFLKENEVVDIPTIAKEVYDVTGAGDTVISVLSLSIASGASLEEAAIISNHAAGMVVTKFGTSTITGKELICAFEREDTKIKKLSEMIRIRTELKRQGQRVVFTNGCFDILHVGHVRILQKTKEFGDVFILGLNTDSSIKRLKGPERPIIKEFERAEKI
ncbi:MAG: D-glycero-beta-D-manno-heptose-7-phosphate kinase, partial [Nanoarchaeota archaeon]|nr:D-glycero-beta-D-manno-heptose-7-phosphate kinase [Nanoarchaeota archaeon]